MAQPKSSKPTRQQPQNKVPIEPGFEKRLADLYKKVLHTPPPRKQGEPPKRPPRGATKK
jgi:hypothetical protein